MNKLMMKVALLGSFLLLLSGVVGHCPLYDRESFIGSCASYSNCTNDGMNCSNSQICCNVGCPSELSCVDSCSEVVCENITCAAPQLIVTVRGECCQSCVDSNQLCPANVPVGNCSINCYNDSKCATNEVCCGNGCGQLCIDPCQFMDCPNVTCTPPYISFTREGECCPSCVMSYCSGQCNDNGSSTNATLFCDNHTVVDNVPTCSDFHVECFNTSITDAAQCVGELSNSNSITTTSLILSQATDEMLNIIALDDENLPPLQSLSIINGRLKYIEDGAFNVSSLTDLINLNLSGNYLTELVYADFMGLDNLSNLDLGNNRIQQLNQDLRSFFMSLQVVNLVGNNFTCDCCLEWLVQCDYSGVILGTEYCSNSQDLASNVSIAELTTEEICPTCRDGMFRYSDSCSRSCTSYRYEDNSCTDYLGLDLWMIIAIGAGAGLILGILFCVLFYYSHRCCCRKKRRNRREPDFEMFRVSVGSADDVNKEGTLGFRNRVVRRFTRKEESEYDDTVNIIDPGRRKTRKKTRKDQTWFHENIYDIDEVDSKFEAFYSEEVTLEEILPYVTKLSLTWYEFGQRLGLDSSRLDTINFAIGSMEGRCQKMLEMWLSTEGPPSRNWETFINALKGGQSTEHKVADEIYNHRSIKTLMTLIYSSAQSKQEDTIVWESWNFFLSKAEGSETYCKHFLNVNGLDLLLYCNQLFTSDWQLKAVFFYILDTIAGYPKLQSYLMRSDVMYACKAMFSTSHYPIISFTAGSVIVRMSIEGDDKWGYLIPNRDEMLNSLSKAIPKWVIEYKMQDDFARGFQKLDHLVRAATNDDNRVSYWGVWALANHCMTSGSVYCVQLRGTGQLARIEQLAQDPKTTTAVMQLCTRVINACEKYN